jgi:signal transduction histidine kinase/DNA-binding NtrC family response regulator
MTTATQSLRVLYLEDNPVDADLTLRELARLAPAMQIEIVTTVAGALERLALACPPYDVVLADLRLPDGSGMDLLSHIRERELPLAVVIITGLGDQEAAVAALKAGADDYLVKRTGALAGLHLVLSAARARFQENLARWSRPLSVLYAEPNASDVDLARRYFTQHSPYIRMENVSSGEEVLARLPVTTGENKQLFDVLLLDYKLPGINALELVKVLRQERGMQIPIVMITGHGDEEVAVQALRLGVDEYLIKDEGYLQRLPVVLEKMQKQVELNVSEERYRLLSQEFNGLLDAIPDSLMLLDRSLNVVWANRGAADCIGESAVNMVGRNCYALCNQRMTPCEPCPGIQCFESGIPTNTTVTRSNGQIWDIRTVPLLDRQGKIAKIIELKRDISEHRKLEAQFMQAQKMESVALLAGGVAHDYNNMLSVILGYSELALENITPVDSLYKYITEIRNAAIRSADITRQLLTFARKQTIAPVALDLNDAIASMRKMLHRLIGEDIDLGCRPTTGLWLVKMDPTQVDQMLANLCVNARDAIGGVGRITIETDMVTIDEAYCVDHPGSIPGEYVLLAISDDGCGMDQETVGKIFEPFFTTKELGKGTGLGLATVHGIVKQNNGFINVYSEPGIGTTFKIYLARHSELAVKKTTESRKEASRGHGEVILLVEDEISILGLAKNILEKLGYKVLTANRSSQALELIKEHHGEINLLITDVIMPEMNGKELSDRIRKVFPELKTLFMSGFTTDIIAHQGVLDDGVNFIQKPFSIESMAVKVDKALNG